MVSVTKTAQKQVAEYFTDKTIMPIRIFFQKGGCGGPQISMALDEKKDSDLIFEVAGIEYIVDTKFHEEAKPVEIDFIETGFKITTSLEPGGCSSCNTEGSCCS